jgi:hypothetical protein
VVAILHREFLEFCEPSDFVEEKRGYGGRLCKWKLRRERAIDSRQRGPSDLLTKFHFGVLWVEGLKFRHLDSQNFEIQNPDTVENFIVGPVLGHVARSKKFRISEFE